MKKLIVMGMIARWPLGGVSWQCLHYILGFMRSGYDVYYIEDTGDYPYNPLLKDYVQECEYNVKYLSDLMLAFDLAGKWAYVSMCGEGGCYGLSREKINCLYGEVDALINVSGATCIREEHKKCKRLIYINTDPVKEHLWVALGDKNTINKMSAHNVHFTFGENLGEPDCKVPLPMFKWKKTRQPVLLDMWVPNFNFSSGRFTTIGNWDVGNWGESEKGIKFNDELYRWSKSVEFLKFIDLPKYTEQKIELALQIPDKNTLQILLNKGWILVDAFEKSKDIWSYRNYIYSSKGEFTVSNNMVVKTPSGWFSDRSACYLASGKPVITQETGFSKFIPTGEGLFVFSTMDDILDAIDKINGDYKKHCKKAREIAEDYFDSKKVLRKLLEDAGVE